jgi:hypothetical protein
VTGAFGAAVNAIALVVRTNPVGADVTADPVPPSLMPRTLTTIVPPTSPAIGVYVEPIAAGMAVQPCPPLSQSSHW